MNSQQSSFETNASRAGKQFQRLYRDRPAAEPRLQPVLVAAPLGALLFLCGCGLQHFTIAAPNTPAIAPSNYYSPDAFAADSTIYKQATDPAPVSAAKTVAYDVTYAKQKRNDITYGLMSQIEVVYGAYYNHLFVYQSSVAIGSDALTLGLSAASSIATHAATKTLFSALGTGIAGIGLSTQKNLFSQQAFPIIGLAMETRRDSLRAQIIQNLANDVATYPLNAAERDLTAYLNAGTLPGGLQEIQSEAGAASAAQSAKNSSVQTIAAPTNLQASAGDHQVTLGWAEVAGASSYNVYFSTTSGLTTTSGTKVAAGISTNSYIHNGLQDGQQYFYLLTAVKGTTESSPSAQASATPAAPAAAGNPPQNLIAIPGASSVTLSWAPPVGAVSFRIYYSQTTPVNNATATQVTGPAITGNSYTVSGLPTGTPLHFVVTAVNAAGAESANSNDAPATPQAPVPTAHSLVFTAH
jgi:Fibronectin type III domain